MSNLLADMMNRPVSEIMTKKLITVIPTDLLQKVREAFEQHNIHHLLVVRHLELVGIISKNDFFKAIHGARLENPEVADSLNDLIFSKFKAEDLMTKHVVKIGPNDKIGTAVEIFLENYFHAVPIVNDAAELVGIVTSYDIMKLFFHQAYPDQELKEIV